MRFEAGQTVTLNAPDGMKVGDMVDICGAGRVHARIISIAPDTSATLKIATRWDIFCYVLMRPRHWKWALDIPFIPPDILVRS